MTLFFKKICVGIIKLCSYGVLCIPLVVAWNTFFPFLFVKVILFRIFVEIAFFAWMVLVFFDRKYLPKFRHPLVFSLFLFFAILTLTMITGVDRYRSFFSTEERMTGVFTMLHMYAWFLILISVFHGKKEWRGLGIWSIGVSGVVALYSIAPWNPDRAFSTLGNQTFLSIYLMLHIFLITYFSVQEKKFRRFFHSILFFIVILQGTAMLLTGSRGPMIALIAGIVGGVLFFFSIHRKKQNEQANKRPDRQGIQMKEAYGHGILRFTQNDRLAARGIVCVIAATIGLLFFINFYQPAKQWMMAYAPTPFARVLFFESYGQGSLTGRPEMWRIGIEGFKERSLLGWGLENYPYVFQKYYTKPLPGDAETYTDRSHNQLIDILALTGIFGFFAYLSLFGVIFFLLLRSAHSEGETRAACAVLVGFFISYFIQGLTIFDSLVALILLYLALGLVYILTSGDRENVTGRNAAKNSIIPKPAFGGMLCIIFFGIVFSLYQWNILQWIKNTQSYYALGRMNGSGITSDTLSLFRESLDSNSFTNYETRLHLSKSVFDAYMARRATSEDMAKQAVLYAIAELDKSIQSRPLDVKNYFSQLLLYRIAVRYDQDILKRLESRMQEAYELAPNRPEIYREFPEMYIALKDYVKAEEWVRRGADHFIPPQETHWQLAIVFLQKGDVENGIGELTEAEKRGYPVFENANMAILLSKKLPDGKKNPAALQYIDRMANMYPDNKDLITAQTEAHKKAE